MQQAMEKVASRLRYVRLRYETRDMLVDLEPNAAGYARSSPYRGGPFDPTRRRLVKAGWDHTHCCVCAATIQAGDEWWASLPPDEVGICLTCHARLFPRE